MFSIGARKDALRDEKRVEEVMKKLAVVLEEEKVSVLEIMDIIVNLQIRLSLKLKEWHNERPA